MTILSVLWSRIWFVGTIVVEAIGLLAFFTRTNSLPDTDKYLIVLAIVGFTFLAMFLQEVFRYEKLKLSIPQLLLDSSSARILQIHFDHRGPSYIIEKRDWISSDGLLAVYKDEDYLISPICIVCIESFTHGPRYPVATIYKEINSTEVVRLMQNFNTAKSLRLVNTIERRHLR